jgi:hypothetical protein
MRNEYLLFPKGLELLECAGFKQRVLELKKEDKLPYLGGHHNINDCLDTINCLKKEGFYEFLPKEFKDSYSLIMNKIFSELSNDCKTSCSWKVFRPEGVVKNQVEDQDLRLFNGEFASYVLKPEEVRQFKEFGFSSPVDLFSTLGLYVFQIANNSSLREGYVWTREDPFGSTIVSEITGNNHADLRIFQKDITSYKTISPFEEESLIRPEVFEDSHSLAPHDSTESKLLTIILKYLNQEKIVLDCFKDNGKKLIEWGKSLGQGGGSCAEHLGGLSNSNPREYFLSWDWPLAKLNSNDETKDLSLEHLSCQSGGFYSAYIGDKKDLVFSYDNKLNRETVKKNIRIRFPVQDAEQLVKGLIYQSAKGLGRTSAKQLFNIIKYRFSPEFISDQEKYT